MSPDFSGARRRHIRAALRLLAGLALLATGADHLEQYVVAHYNLIPTIGPLFLLNFVGGTVLGLYLLVPAPSQTGPVRGFMDAIAALSGVALAGAGLIALFVSEQMPLFGFMEHGYRPEIVVALVAEATAVLTLLALVALNPSQPSTPTGPAPGYRASPESTGLEGEGPSAHRLCSIAVPGLDVRRDWRLVHDRLLDEFAEIVEVLPTITKNTVLIVYSGTTATDAWLDTISETLLNFGSVVQPARPTTSHRYHAAG